MQGVDCIFELREGLIHHVTLLEHELRELILFAIHPKVWEGLLSTVKDLNQIVER